MDLKFLWGLSARVTNLISFYYSDIFEAFPKFYSACPVPAVTVLELSKRGKIPGVKVREFLLFDLIWAKFYLESFSILDLSLKVLQWTWISLHLLHLFPPASFLNEIWAWKQVFRSYFQLQAPCFWQLWIHSPSLRKFFAASIHLSLSANWPEGPQLFSFLAFHS